MQIIQSYITNNQCYKNAKKINITGLMLHSTGCAQSKASAYINAFNKPTVQKAVHAFIQEDGKVYQTLPWNWKAWHCGSGPKGSGNSNMIGVEICEPDTIKYTSGSGWTDKDPAKTKASVLATYKYAVELFAYLAKQYNINPLKDGAVICHSEGHSRGIASGHADVMHLWKPFGLTMDMFRQDVAKAMNGTLPSTPTTQPTTYPYKLYTVNVEKGDTLNIRNKPNGDIIGTLGRNMIMPAKDPDGDGWYQLASSGYVYGKKYLKPYTSKYNLKVDYFRIRTKDNMNVRSDPMTGNNIIGTAKANNVFTIVATYGNWGLLKAGGFISISDKYVTRL